MKTIIYLLTSTETEKVNKTKDNNLLLTHFGEKCAENYAKSIEFEKIDYVYTSQTMQSKETAEYIAYENNVEVNIVKEFDERKIGNREKLLNEWKGKKYSYATAQLLDEKLKDEGGESREDVSKRFLEAIKEIITEKERSRIVIVSHNTAIKCFLMNYCTLNEKYELIYNGKVVVSKRIDFPYAIKITFDGNKLVDIQKVKCEKN